MLTSFPELLARTRVLISRLESEGVSIPKSSRFRRYLSELEHAAEEQYAQPPDSVLRRRHRLLIEVDDLEIILDSLNRHPIVTGWKERVQEALKGHFLWTEDAEYESARNIQFELVLAALVRSAGYDVRLGKTDVIVQIGQTTLGIEAKRPRSPKKVRANLKKAARQLIAANLSGLLAIDATVVVNEKDKHARLIDVAKAHAALAEHATSVARHMVSIVAARFGTQHVCGLLLRASFPTWHPDDRILGYVQRWPLVCVLSPDDPRRTVIEELAEALRRRLESTV